jgi:uncharacterized membrane protein YbhN (UPF0104 family)
MPKNKFLYISLSLVISVILIWLLLFKIKIEDLIRTFQQIYWPALLAYMAVTLLGTGFRAWRYKWLLQPQPVSWANIILVTFVRNSLVDLLPLRIGSLSYIYILNKRLDFSFEMATSTFVLAFVFDFLTLSPFLILAILAVGLGTISISNFTLLFLALLFFFINFLILWKIIPVFSFLIKISQSLLRISKLERKNWTKIAIEKAKSTLSSFAEIQKRKLYFPVFFLSLLVRLTKYIAVFFLLFSLLRSQGFIFYELNFWKTILGLTGAELTSILPIKGLAGFGTWESAWALTLELMKFSPQIAIISGIGVHFITNLFEYTLGIASLFILGLPLIRERSQKKQG